MRTLKAKWAGRCVECDMAFDAGEEITWTGQAFHKACYEATMAKQAAEDAEERAFQAKHMAECKAGLRIKMRATDKELVVTGAPSYAMARAEAQAFVCSVRAAGGKATLLAKTKNGKRYVGRELVTYYGMSNLGHHEGYAFRYEVE